MIEESQGRADATFTIKVPIFGTPRGAMPRAARWLAEIAGICAIAVAASLWWLPAGIAVAGVYLLIASNVGGE